MIRFSMIRLFCGFDAREAHGYEVFVSSVRRRTDAAVSFEKVDEMGCNHFGTNAFTFTRFLVPRLCGFQGHAIFCDAVDQIMLADVAELEALFDPRYAVQVVKHANYTTRHPMKYRGTDMECPNVNYPRKNWASVMLMNCEHPAWRNVADFTMRGLLELRHVPEEAIGALPDEWNRLVDEGHAVDGAKLMHWTAGTPNLSRHYANSPGADLWRAEDSAAA
jgi:hypothetical protein